MNKNILGDRIAFVLYKIIFGMIYHEAFSSLLKFQNSALNFKNQALSFLGYFVPTLLLIWFFDVDRKKSTWKPLGKHSDMIGTLIIIFIIIVMDIIIRSA